MCKIKVFDSLLEINWLKRFGKTLSMEFLISDSFLASFLIAFESYNDPFSLVICSPQNLALSPKEFCMCLLICMFFKCLFLFYKFTNYFIFQNFNDDCFHDQILP